MTNRLKMLNTALKQRIFLPHEFYRQLNLCNFFNIVIMARKFDPKRSVTKYRYS